ncbi:MAG: FmdB family zinc ribbon protein [Candidatus Krumholzibacteriia bacterium]
MPLFEFVCRSCGRKFEEILSLAELEAEPPACPACGAERAERALSRFATGGGGAAAGGGGGCGTSGFS